MDKELVNSQLNIKSFYQSIIPSLKENGKAQTIGLCPFHDDHAPSLSVNLENGLYNCFACGAKGDVFTFYQKIKGVNFATACNEIAEMQGISEGTITTPKVVATFKYQDIEGKTIYIKERIEPGPKGKSKTFVFKHFAGNTWILGRGCDPIPYNLPAVIRLKSIYIVEGEGKADLLNQWGLVTTSLDSGANSQWKEHYMEYFKSIEEVVILPDNDAPGRSYAAKIAGELYGKAKAIKVVGLDGLNNRGDIIDWAKHEGNNREKLIDIVKRAPEWEPPKVVTVTDDIEAEIDTPAIDLNYEALPCFLKELIAMLSPTTLAPDEFLITALLSSMSSVVGTGAYIQIGRRKFYPAIWSMLIAPSSDYFKSTATKEARNFILPIDKEYEEQYQEMFALYSIELKVYEALSKNNKQSTKEPVEPVRKEIDFSDDETMESFYQTLHDNPNGGLLAFDEIGGWVEGFDKYRKGDGDKRRWLSIFDNSPIKYKRKTNKTKLIIEKPFVSIIGGITCNTFNTLFKGVRDIENGFLPRFLFCQKPKLIKEDKGFLMPDIDGGRWGEAQKVFKIVSDLHPGAVTLSQEGLEMINAWYIKHQLQKKEAYFPEELAPFWRRHEGYLLKFALIFHQFKRATGSATGNIISIETLGEAMSLIEFYKDQASAVIDSLCQGQSARLFDDMVILLNRLGGKATLREIHHAKTFWRGKRTYLLETLSKMEIEGILTLEEYVAGGKEGTRAILNITANNPSQRHNRAKPL